MYFMVGDMFGILMFYIIWDEGKRKARLSLHFGFELHSHIVGYKTLQCWPPWRALACMLEIWLSRKRIWQLFVYTKWQYSSLLGIQHRECISSAYDVKYWADWPSTWSACIDVELKGLMCCKENGETKRHKYRRRTCSWYVTM